jgi:hypothetical protein
VEGVSLANSKIVEKGFRSSYLLGVDQPQVIHNTLWISNDDNPPEYFDPKGIVTPICAHSRGEIARSASGQS